MLPVPLFVNVTWHFAVEHSLLWVAGLLACSCVQHCCIASYLLQGRAATACICFLRSLQLLAQPDAGTDDHYQEQPQHQVRRCQQGSRHGVTVFAAQTVTLQLQPE